MSRQWRQFGQDRNFGMPQTSLNYGAAEFVPTGGNLQSQDVRESRNWQPPSTQWRNLGPSGSAGGGNGRFRGENQARKVPKPMENSQKILDSSLSVRIGHQLTLEQYECLVCCDQIRLKHAVWSCASCFAVFHLRCVKRWANSSSDAEGWRCPGCQHITVSVPDVYYCFCGAMRNPPVGIAGQQIPHSCGEPCQKPRKADCRHKCPELCHPGPCDICPAIVDRQCHCGKTSRKVQCGSDKELQCTEPCIKLLNCGVHQCAVVCHSGDCQKCAEEVPQTCFCGRKSRVVCCTKETAAVANFGCELVCDKQLDCGNHRCGRLCHSGPCEQCQLTPELVTRCSCGKSVLTNPDLRQQCTDPVETCGQTCGKTLLCCGDGGDAHNCESLCHVGTCPPCLKEAKVACRCQRNVVTLTCTDLLAKISSGEPILCNRPCKKQKNCRRHKCNDVCCVDLEHICTLICGYKLSCGIHLCESLCHSGPCCPCYVASFEELTCECGANVLFPPIRCGTKPPPCDQPCPRSHSCEHPVNHNCHSEPLCPPCTVLTRKFCYGQHEMRNNIPCYLMDVSCGKVCTKPLDCGHNCNRICHPGECLAQPCAQPCPQLRSSCGHPCALPCHGDAPCQPDSVCRHQAQLTCSCGNRKSKMSCAEFERQMASIQQQLQTRRGSSDNSDTEAKTDKPAKIVIMKRAVLPSEGESNSILLRQNSQNKYECLSCNPECKRIERNRQLAAALDIETPDLTGNLDVPIYTDFLKSQAKCSSAAVVAIEKDLTELVSLANSSSAVSRSHVFQPMNKDQRRIIHEYSEYWDIQTVSYDQEPQRNVVATAKKGKSHVPLKLLSVLYGQEAVKQPIMRFGPKPIGTNFWK